MNYRENSPCAPHGTKFQYGTLYSRELSSQLRVSWSGDRSGPGLIFKRRDVTNGDEREEGDEVAMSKLQIYLVLCQAILPSPSENFSGIVREYEE